MLKFNNYLVKVGKKVLVIEPDFDIRFIVKYILEMEGYDILASSDFNYEGLESYNADLVILADWQNYKRLSVTCDQVTLLHTNLHLPVLLFSTAVNIEETVSSCKADGFIRKPFDLNELLQTVRSFSNLNQDV